MSEQFARVGELDICFETFGDPSDPAMLLIMGLGTQMVAWHDDFCAELAGRGFFVIRHDNRDIGRSTHLSQRKPPPIWKLVMRDRNPPYTLADMAADSVGVLDHLGIEQAHIVGASMGGMIAQTVAIRYPERALSLVSLFSNTGGFLNGQPAMTMYAVLLRPAPREREPFINHAVTMFEKIGGKGYEPGVEDLTAIATRSFDRGGDPRRADAPARRDRGRPRPHAAAAPPQPARDGHPRHRRQARAPVRRPRDRARHPGSAAGRDRGHGPRPAARRLADHPRRDRGHGAARGRAGAGQSSTRMSTITIRISSAAPPAARACH